MTNAGQPPPGIPRDRWERLVRSAADDLNRLADFERERTPDTVAECILATRRRHRDGELDRPNAIWVLRANLDITEEEAGILLDLDGDP